jgi:hypothetical protein
LLEQLIEDSGEQNWLLSSGLKDGSGRKSMFPIIAVLDVHESGSPKGGKQPRIPNVPPDRARPSAMWPSASSKWVRCRLNYIAAVLSHLAELSCRCRQRSPRRSRISELRYCWDSGWPCAARHSRAELRVNQARPAVRGDQQ